MHDAVHLLAHRRVPLGLLVAAALVAAGGVAAFVALRGTKAQPQLNPEFALAA